MKHEGGCPSCASLGGSLGQTESGGFRLSHWPIQIKLIGTVAPFLQDADLVVAADCTGFSVHGIHERFLEGKKVLIGCPKLDDGQFYVDKLSEIFANNSVQKVQCLRMEVPCCGGMTMILKEAIKRSGKNIPLKETILGIKGDVISEKDIA